MNKSIKILGLIAIIMISSLFIFSTNTTIEKNTDGKIENDKNTSETYRIKALKIPLNLTFAGEKVPLEKADIKERIDRELLVNTYWQSNGLLLFKRAHKYFPIIEPILEKNGIPNDFKYLAVIESGLQNVTSPAGARGFWQIMKSTGRENGLEINTNVDERYHLEKATQVACDYLNAAKERFGSWTMAAAAYNAGNAGMARKIEAQKVTSYYDLLLGEETQRYVPRMVALKEILSNPQKYGFVFETEDLYKLEQTKTIKVDTAITNIAQFSKNLGINYKVLKIHNPWLRENNLNNKSRKLYELKIPSEN
ncbi:MAG: lytic transglycosylase domain-containing protein [Lutibacter sp.]|uniref:lytic transglycosylase domain-containing protein n=1 Tax=Lutibacter sp. TaxID=1925666 RepID=UPI001839911A|nr:lytic transglycosylase domain-containing protein [Lutibacter sp.]MBT8316918.1 lytic transglycosylase domain-containing protein [Lutibacter sp.]NNJ57778.1 lytic transglycosylase domain-containing protein [Lutibacter sp.]